MEEKNLPRNQNNPELTKKQIYTLENIVFVVETIFSERSENTITSVLYSLMRNDAEQL